MPDRRQHRGAHPADARLFAPARLAALRTAVADLGWLLGRGYADTAALKLVGDHYRLTARQRLAVRRASCSDARRDRRLAHRLEAGPGALAGRDLQVDGFNCLITVESALAGGLLLVGRDRALRDLASVHGTWRRVEETAAAARALGELVAAAAPASVRWLLDQPVSNSGRLAALLGELAAGEGWPWRVELVPSPDRALLASDAVVASSDGPLLDRVRSWVDLPRAAVERRAPRAWLVDLAPAA